MDLHPPPAVALPRVAAVYADVILAGIRREYPHDLHYTMSGPDDRPTPRQLHPAFYGCYDWHSCVEMHWALIRLLQLVPRTLDHQAARATLRTHLTPAALSAEAGYLRAHRGFERPYGWGWALMLADALASWDDADASVWTTAMQPLAETITDLLLAWLPNATYPNRSGVHGNTAFALARALPWARRLAGQGDARLLAAITDAVTRWYRDDQNYPASWEPSGADFLSPALAEAEVMSEILDGATFRRWFEWTDAPAVDPSGPDVICAHRRFRRLPLAVVAGPGGVGKTTLYERLAPQLECVVCLETDLLWGVVPASSDDNYRSYIDTWLHLAAAIAQAGRPVALFGPALPATVAACINSRFFSAAHYLCLVGDDTLIAERLRARPAWRQAGGDAYIAEQLQFNRWLKAQAGRIDPPMQLLDVTDQSTETTAALVTAFLQRSTLEAGL